MFKKSSEARIENPVPPDLPREPSDDEIALSRSLFGHVVVDRRDRPSRDLSVLAPGTHAKVGDVCFWMHQLCRVVSDDGPATRDRLITIEKVLRDEQISLWRSRVMPVAGD